MSNYRNDIEGLRALAILVIIFFHFEVTYFEGGYIGVDIFFVISGYLLSLNISKRLADNSFSFKVFYMNRMRRLFPALFGLLVFSSLFAVLFFDYDALVSYGKSLVYTVTFTSNFYFRKSVGYFAPSAFQVPLLHTWSLAVEEQFYLTLPILLFFLRKFSQKIFFFVIIFLFSFSFLLFCNFNKYHSQFAFYMFPTRAWEFLFGTFLANKVLHRLPVFFNKNLFSAIGLALIFFVLFYPSIEGLYHFNLLAILGTGIIIHTSEGGKSGIINKILATSFFRSIGRMSYSLYLWHWVVFVFYRYLLISEYDKLDTLAVLLLCFILSYFSWRFIESPYLDKNRHYSNSFFLTRFSLLIVFFILIGFILIYSNGMPWRKIENKVLKDAKTDRIWDKLAKKELDILSNPMTAEVIFKLGHNNKKSNILFWGDSHARALAGGLDSIARKNNCSVYIAQFSGNIPLQNVERSDNKSFPSMSLLNRRVLNLVVNNPEIEKVVLVGRWCAYVGKGNVFDDRKNPLILIPKKIEWEKYKGDNFKLFELGLRETIVKLVSSQKKVILVTDVPQLNVYPVNLIVRNRLTGINVNDLTPLRPDYEKNNNRINEFFNNLRREGLIDDIVPIHENFFLNGRTIIMENQKLLFRDDDHLSLYGSLKAANDFSKFL